MTFRWKDKNIAPATRQLLLALFVVCFIWTANNSHARAELGYVGLHVQEMSVEMANALSLPVAKGVLVRDVALDGAANTAGIRRGDLIQNVNGKDIPNVKTLVMVFTKLKAGERIPVLGLRRGQPFSWKLELGTWPESRRVKKGAFANIPALGLTMAAITPKVRERFQLRWGAVGVMVSLIDDKRSGGMNLKRGEVIRLINYEEVWLPQQVIKAYQDAKASGRKILLALVEGQAGFRFIKIPIR